MQTETGLNADIGLLLRCPACKSRVESAAEEVLCRSCGKTYPIVGAIPILIDDERSVFSREDFVSHSTTFFPKPARLTRCLNRILPRISRNTTAKRNYARFARAVCELSDAPRVLVLGGSILGDGMEELLKFPHIRLVETDVSFGPRTAIVCDGHDIPFADASFDGVVIQAVLEHVLDPYRCVEEVHRVLKPDCLVYAETAFMQPVHGRAYDFARFTPLGHRRLFRQFEEIDSGAAVGPGTALAYAWQYFLYSFARRKSARAAMRAIGHWTGWLWKYFDAFLVRNDQSLDAAAGVYFLGRRSESVLPDKELIGQYRGGFR